MILDNLVSRYTNGDRGVTHLLAARDGKVVAEWYRPCRDRTSPHMLHSSAKSFINTGIGIAIAEGLLSLDDKLFDFLTDAERQIAVPEIATLTIKHMLMMCTGHSEGTSGVVWRTLKTSWVDEYLKMPITGTPGIDFIYSSGTSHMLSMCLQRVTGLPADEYLRPRLFEPLGFADLTWDRDPDGICSGGNGLTLNVLDFLKWGQLYLNGGVWEGRRILTREWVEASLTRQVDAGSLVWTGDGYGADKTSASGEGYGYHIWHRPGGNYAAGIFGQYCVIIPESNSVIAVFSSLTSKESDPLSLDLIEAGRSETFVSFEAPLETGLTLESEPSITELVKAMLSGRFASTDGEVELAFSIEEGDAGAVLNVRGHDSTGAVDVTAGIDHMHEFVAPLGAPTLHHSYSEVTLGLATLERLGPWHVEAAVHYPVTPFMDHYSFELDTAGVIRYGRRVNVNSQGTTTPEVFLRRIIEN